MQIREITLEEKPNLPKEVYVRRWLVKDMDAERFMEELAINGKCIIKETKRIGDNIGFVSICEEPVNDLIPDQFDAKPLSEWRKLKVTVALMDSLKQEIEML